MSWFYLTYYFEIPKRWFGMKMGYKKYNSSTTLKTCDASNEKSGNISRLNKNNTNLKNFLNFLNLVKPKLPTHQTTSPDCLYP